MQNQQAESGFNLDSIRYKRIPDDIDEQARIASRELNPFGESYEI